MNRLGTLGIALLSLVLLAGVADKANAQVVYRVYRPYAVAGNAYYYPTYPYPAYSYSGGWYPGSYQNLYGNYGAYHVMQPIWTGGYYYRYR